MSFPRLCLRSIQKRDEGRGMRVAAAEKGARLAFPPTTHGHGMPGNASLAPFPRPSPRLSNSQDPLAPADTGRTGTDSFQNHPRLDCLQERVELLAGAGQLDRVALVGDIEDAAAEDVGEALHLVAILAGRAHLDEHQLALDVVALGQVDDLHDLDKLVQLLGDLLDDVVGTARDDRHPRHRRVFRRRNGQRLDVVAARGKQSRDTRQRAGFVLDQNGEDVSHGCLCWNADPSPTSLTRLPLPASGERVGVRGDQSSSARIISVNPFPPGTIGNTFSVWSVMKSRNTSRSFRANASRSAPSTSRGCSTLIPTWP